MKFEYDIDKTKFTVDKKHVKELTCDLCDQVLECYMLSKQKIHCDCSAMIGTPKGSLLKLKNIKKPKKQNTENLNLELP